MGNYLYRGIKNDIKCAITDKNSNKCSTICTSIKNLNCMEYNYYAPTNKSIIRPLLPQPISIAFPVFEAKLSALLC